MAPDDDRRRGLFGLPRLSGEERELALQHPGPGWREFFLYEFLKWWAGVGFLTIDVLVAGSFLMPLNLFLLVPSLGAALYLEFIAFQYVWYRPPLDEPRSRDGFHRTWRRWVEYGRWTPEARRVRDGLDPYLDRPRGPDAADFF